jgi:hypothetical protein
MYRFPVAIATVAVSERAPRAALQDTAVPAEVAAFKRVCACRPPALAMRTTRPPDLLTDAIRGRRKER